MDVKDRFTREDFAEALLSGNVEARQKFSESFNKEIQEFLDRVFAAYERFLQLGGNVRLDDRSAWVQMFLFNAINAVVSAFHLVTVQVVPGSC